MADPRSAATTPGPFARAWTRIRADAIAPGEACNLGVVRIALCAGWLLYVDADLARHFTTYGPALWMPPGVWRDVLPHIALTPAHVATLDAMFLTTGLLAMVGLWTRTALALMLATGLPLLLYPQCFGHVSHSHHLVWGGLLLLASPCGDACSIDAMMVRRGKGEPLPSLAYAIPCRALMLLVGIAYFFPGVWKLVHVGSYWLTPSNFIMILHQKWTELPQGVWVLRMDQWPIVCGVAASATVLFELLFLPAAALPTLRRRLMPALLVVGLGFHVATFFVMHIVFLHMLACYPACIDWHALRRRITSREPRRDPSAPRREGWIRVSLVVAIVLIAGNLVQGLTLRQDWPLGCYPTFAHRAGPARDMLEFVVVGDEGGVRRLTEPMLAVHSTPSRVRTLCHVIMTDEARRDERVRALWRVWCEIDPTLRRAREVRAERVTINVQPDASPRETAREVLLTLTP